MHPRTQSEMQVKARLVGGPTLILEFAGLRLLTDPTFDGPGDYDTGRGYKLRKIEQPALSPEEVGPVDVVLLSHDHHADNLDISGRAFLMNAPLVLTTVSGAQRLGSHATPLTRWSHVDIPRPDGGILRITGVPAQHGPDGMDDLLGEVTGFVLSGTGVPTIYVSGDNASVDVVRSIVEVLGRVDIAVLFVGGARSPLLGDAYLTLNGERAAEAARVLGASRVVPIHGDGWAHYSEGIDAVQSAFEIAGVESRLRVLKAGVWATL
jgi:L-ascorbate metabolism protein UlaG (beta-lactamase superfamily)